MELLSHWRSPENQVPRTLKRTEYTYRQLAAIEKKKSESRRNIFVVVVVCLFLFYQGLMRLMLTCVLAHYVTFTVLLVPKPFGGRWPSRWTTMRRYSVPLQWHNQFWQSLVEGAGKPMLGVWLGATPLSYPLSATMFQSCSAKTYSALQNI